MSGRVLGRKPGETCNACTTGRLVAIFQSRQDCNPRVGGPPGPAPSIHHLVCSGCGLWYASSVHGSLDSVLRKQLDQFVQPAEQPTHCACGDEAAEHVMDGPFGRTRRDGPFAENVLHCAACVRLLWKFPRAIDERMKGLKLDLPSDKNTPP